MPKRDFQCFHVLFCFKSLLIGSSQQELWWGCIKKRRQRNYMFFVLCVLHYSQSKATIKKLIAASTMCQECSFWLKMTHKTHKYLIRYVWQNIDQHFKYLRVLCFLAKTRIHFLSPHWDLVYIFGGLFHVASQIATSASKNEKHQGFKIGPKPIALSVFYIQSMLWIHIMDFKNVLHK